MFPISWEAGLSCLFLNRRYNSTLQYQWLVYPLKSNDSCHDALLGGMHRNIGSSWLEYMFFRTTVFCISSRVSLFKFSLLIIQFEYSICILYVSMLCHVITAHQERDAFQTSRLPRVSHPTAPSYHYRRLKNRYTVEVSNTFEVQKSRLSVPVPILKRTVWQTPQHKSPLAL